MVELLDNVENSVWHAFDYLALEGNGTAPKTKLKVSPIHLPFFPSIFGNQLASLILRRKSHIKKQSLYLICKHVDEWREFKKICANRGRWGLLEDEQQNSQGVGFYHIYYVPTFMKEHRRPRSWSSVTSTPLEKSAQMSGLVANKRSNICNMLLLTNQKNH